jgi:hypothetical protein
MFDQPLSLCPASRITVPVEEMVQLFPAGPGTQSYSYERGGVDPP